MNFCDFSTQYHWSRFSYESESGLLKWLDSRSQPPPPPPFFSRFMICYPQLCDASACSIWTCHWINACAFWPWLMKLGDLFCLLEEFDAFIVGIILLMSTNSFIPISNTIIRNSWKVEKHFRKILNIEFFKGSFLFFLQKKEKKSMEVNF